MSLILQYIVQYIFCLKLITCLKILMIPFKFGIKLFYKAVALPYKPAIP